MTDQPQRSSSRYFVIQDPGDTKPWALISMERGIAEWWTHEGWIDTPAFMSYFSGEPGAHPIDPNDLEMWQKVIQKPSPGAVAMMRARH